jgi:hypothetical protein
MRSRQAMASAIPRASNGSSAGNLPCRIAGVAAWLTSKTRVSILSFQLKTMPVARTTPCIYPIMKA